MNTLERSYADHRMMLFGLAYRMLGIAADAEDVVQDVYSAYMQTEPEDVRNERAYLARMTVNRCINLLRSSRRQRETYTGPWLPEPIPTDDGETDPAVRREAVGYAYLVLLQRLTPLERAVYIMRESLGFEYADIAGMLDKTEAACRKIYSRARSKAGGAGASEHADSRRLEAQERFVEAFLQASDTGRFMPLVEFLKEEIVLLTDGGGKVRAAINPIEGSKRVLAFFEGLAAKGVYREGFRRITLNGEPGLVQLRDGRAALTLLAEWEPDGSRITRLYMVRNPDKLTRF